MLLQELAREYQKRVSLFEDYQMDSHIMADGVYVKLTLFEPIDTQLKALKERTLLYNRKDELEKEHQELFEWFKSRDFYNIVLNDDSNKVVDTKRKIWSTTMYSLSLREKNVEKATREEIINFLESHFSKLNSRFRLEELKKVISPLVKKNKGNKQEELERLLETQFPSLIARLSSEEREDEYAQSCAFFQQYYFLIKDELEKIYGDSISKDKYIKLYLDFSVEDYHEEFKLYAYPKIFRKNEYNATSNNSVVGVPMYGINLNDKKPFLEFKTTRFKYPFLITLEEALKHREIFPWIKYLSNDDNTRTTNKKVSYYQTSDETLIDNHSFHHVLIDGNDIVDYDNVPVGSSAIKFTWWNVVNVKLVEEQDQRVHEQITNIKRLRDLANTYFFMGRLQYSNYRENPDVVPSVFTATMGTLFIQSRQSLFDFFFKSTALGLSRQTLKNMLQFLYEQIRQGIINTPTKKDENKESNASPLIKQKNYYARGINLYLSLCEYVNKEDTMKSKITDVQEQLEEQLLYHSEYRLQSNEEFYYLSGQLCFYILNNFSKAQTKSFNMMQGLYRLKKPSQVKKYLRQQFKTYSHEISLSHHRLKKAMQWIQEADVDENAKMTTNEEAALFAGLVGENLFYLKKENEDNE